MNHNTARCSSCNTICVLPHLRARASAAKCEACARREAERVRDSRAFETEPRDPFLNNMVGPPRGSFNSILKRVYADDFRITVPRDAVIYDDKREQRARELTEEKRRERPKCIAYHYSDLRMEYAFMYEDGSKSHASLQETVDAYEPVLGRLGGVSPAVELLKRIGEYLRFEAAAT